MRYSYKDKTPYVGGNTALTDNEIYYYKDILHVILLKNIIGSVTVFFISIKYPQTVSNILYLKFFFLASICMWMWN